MEEADAIRKIRALLAKAEATDSPDEAKSFTAKAFEIAAKFRIDHAKLVAEGQAPPEQQVQYSIKLLRPFQQRIYLLNAVYETAGCMSVKIAEDKVHVFGFKSDMERSAILLASLTVQGERQWAAWDHPAKKTRYLQTRRAFWHKYARDLRERLEALNKNAEDGIPGSAIVLYDRSVEVEAAMREYHPNARYLKHMGPGDRAGREAGAKAAREADIGQTGVGGDRKVLR